LLQDLLSKINSVDFYQTVLIWGLHFGGIILSAVVGTFISKKIKQTQLIMLWMIIGTLSSLAVATVNPLDIVQISLIGLLLGVSLGFGMPSCISRFAESIPVGNRGRASGITLFASGIGIVAFSISGISGVIMFGVVLAIWRLAGLIIFLLAKVPSSPISIKKSTSNYKKIVNQHSFILYFVPWVMFSLINYLVAPTTPNLGGADAANLVVVQTGFMGVFALLGGFFIDSMGRKRVAVTGFILLGLGTAILGISNTSVPILFFNAILDGTAWGFLLVLFILTLWGDLSFSESSEKYYALGVIPFFVSNFLGLTIGSGISSHLSDSSALFSFGALFLFLAVLPLIYAPETLPEKAIKDRDLKSYVEKARKAALKEEEKKQKKKEETNQASEDKEEKHNNEYDEARKLAEKYY
jgi:MFS family permease